MKKPKLCQHCGKKPDFRGLQEHHLKLRSRGGKKGETEFWCAPCHFGPDGHRTEGMPKSEPVYDNTPEIFHRAGRPCPKPDPKKKEKK